MGVLALMGRLGEEGYWDDRDDFMRCDDWLTGSKQRELESDSTLCFSTTD